MSSPTAKQPSIKAGSSRTSDEDLAPSDSISQANRPPKENRNAMSDWSLKAASLLDDIDVDKYTPYGPTTPNHLITLES
ncbi:hypothetical protein RhiTH_007927 [Rhizoctonia solani]